jgi:hypothetical protein
MKHRSIATTGLSNATQAAKNPDSCERRAIGFRGA